MAVDVIMVESLNGCRVWRVVRKRWNRLWRPAPEGGALPLLAAGMRERSNTLLDIGEITVIQDGVVLACHDLELTLDNFVKITYSSP